MSAPIRDPVCGKAGSTYLAHLHVDCGPCLECVDSKRCRQLLLVMEKMEMEARKPSTLVQRRSVLSGLGRKGRLPEQRNALSRGSWGSTGGEVSSNAESAASRLADWQKPSRTRRSGRKRAAVLWGPLRLAGLHDHVVFKPPASLRSGPVRNETVRRRRAARRFAMTRRVGTGALEQTAAAA